MTRVCQIFIATLTIAVSGGISAATLYSLDFNTLGGSGISYSNTGTGTTSIASTGGYNNYNGNTKDGSAFSHSPHGGTFSIKDSGGIGADTAQGFSIELDVRQSGSNWADLFSITVGEFAIKFEKKGNTGGLSFYNDATTPGGTKTSSDLDNYTIPFSLSANTWSTVRMSFQEKTAGTTTIDFYKDGTFQGSTTSTDLVGNLIEVRGKANAANVDDGTNWLMDNFTVVAIPEPSSLTLLGLASFAGLSIRRRGA